nr:kinetochore scaffold 1 isoform X2 [Pelodiscus sinensis]XP_006128730.1 kinetochore scaffold 1 isoform X2 [Pelodiscus sinensis]|eukprot:XP_006128729.1 kinetochore scaffold 1 isoform X2 [Pelodiscus sinensis]
MDRIYSESNDENDHTERIRRQRLSSILKAPRSPLKDLGSGNEFTQDYDTGKRRKNSRRVSFADTIKVFQTDLQTNEEPENTERATNERNPVLSNQNEDAEAVHCEITGMDTLLHAPIQTLVQQTEWNVNNQTNRNDRTLIFLDENEMDMTASHTAVITRNLKSNEEIDKPRKIDIKSFLAELTSKNEGSEMKTEFRFFCDPTEANYTCPSLQQKPDRDPVKKIDFNEFLTSLKSSETFVSPTVEGPDKENLFFVPIQVSESSGFSPTEYVYSHTQENTDNVTRIFRGEDGGMDITKCHVSNINTMFPNTCEASSKQLEYGDVTVAYGDMDMTTCQTVKMSPSKNNAVTIENQSQNTRMDLSSSFAADNSRLKRTSNDQLIVPQASERCVENKTVSVEEEEDITRSHTILTDNHKASETSNQGCRSRTVVPGCVSPESVFHNDKTIVFSSCNDMEMTGNCTMVNYNETSKATGRFFFDAFKKAGNASSLLMEKTVSGDENMDITKCQITSDNHVLRQCKNKPQTIFSVPNNASEKGIRSHGAASETPGLHLCANPGAWTSKDTFQLRAVKGTEKSLLGDKTIVFSGEDMNITRSYIAKNVEEDIASQLPPVSAAMSNGMKFKPQIFGNKSSSSRLNDQEEMEITKCHAVVIDNQNTGITTSLQQIQPKAIPGEKWDKQVNEAVNPLNLDKEISCSEIGDHMDIKRSHPNAKTIIFSSQEQEMDISKSHIFVSHNCEISQQLRKSLVNPSLAYTNDKTVFPDDQSMDITRNHIDALEFAPIFVAQEYESTHTQNSIISKPLQNKTLFSGGSDIDITRSQTAAIECGSLRMNSNQEDNAPENNQIPALAAARFSFTSGDESLPSGVNGDVHFGKIAGIYIDSKNSELQQQSYTVTAFNKTVANSANPEMLSSTHKAASLSSKQDFTKSQTVKIDYMNLRGAEQLSLARTSMLDTENSQMASLLEKSVVCFSEENMDLTGSHVVNVPNTVLTEREENTLFPPKKDLTSSCIMIAEDSLQKQRCDQCRWTYAKKTLSRNDLLLSLPNKKTVIFSADDDMEMTKTHALATDNKIYLQGKISSKAVPLVPADKTVVFTSNDDMDITRPNTVVIDKSLAAPQIVSELDKGTGTRRLIGSSSEKTVVFSIGDENDMEMTKTHALATDNKIYLQGKISSKAVPLVPADKTVVFTCSDDMDITRPNTVVIDKSLAAPQIVSELDKGTGTRRLIGSSSEKTVVFSIGDENDMEMTKTHALATDNKIYLQGKISSKAVPLVPADKTVVFTCNDDMDITRPNTVVIDKSLAAPQIVSELDKGTGTRRLIGSSSEKTVVFSIGDENDMEMTKTHALATDNKIYLQGKISSKAVPLVPADKTVVFTCNDDMDITRPNTVVIDKSLAAPQIVSELDKGTGTRRLIGSSSEKTVVFPLGGENDMLVTKSHTAAINHEIVPQGKRPPPAQSAFQGGEMVFAFNQADMEIIESHTVDKTVEKIMHVDRLKLDKCVKQEAFSNSKTVLFVMGDDMETTKIHTVSLDDEIALQGAQTTHVVPVLPANETIMFTCNQDKMDITASHTVAINSNNLQGSENQEVSSESHQQQNLWRISAPTYGERMHFKHAEDLGNGCHSDSRDKRGLDFPAFSASVFPYKKEETDTFKIHNVATEKSIGPLSLPLPEVILDIVQEPQNVVNLPTGSSSSVYCQDLRKQVKLKSKRVSFKLPENQTESLTYKTESQIKEAAENSLLDCDGKNGIGMSQVQIPVQQSHLSKESIDSLIRDAVNVLETGSIDLKDNSEKLASTRHEHKPSEVDTDGADMVISYKESKECKRVTAEWEKLTKDFQEDSEQTKQFSQVSDICAEQVDPKLVPELSGIVNICIRLKNCRRKSEVFPVSQTAAGSNLAENFPKLATHSEDLLSLGKDVEKESNNAFDIKEEENVYFETGDAPAGTPLDTTHRDKCQVRKLPLGIFPPKLPNKRDSVAPSVCLNVKATSRVEAQASEINSVTGKTSDIICPIERQNLSPSQYIDEELLPTCPEEMDSAEFVSYEPHDGTCNEMNKKERFCNKSNPLEEQETCNNQKRAWEQEEEELQKGKKIKRTESWDRDTTKEQQVASSVILSHSQAETHEGENPSSPSSKSLERTNSSNSSCLDSLKADTDFSIQRSSQRESQLLMDSICEENVFEKFQDGVITVGEFFTLLQVHILIQKPRQSHLPANYVVDTAPTPEDLIFSQYIYQPKLQIYEEDCQVLSQMRENLKLCAGVQDKLLVDVNKNLWEVMRTCSDKELKNFGTELNKMKSCFTKKSKVLAHKGKVKLYDSLVQNTQIQWEKLQSRIAKVDEFLREMDSCLCALETVAELEECDADISDPVTDWESKVRHLEKELENLKAQEEALQRNLTNLEARKQQGFSEINCLQTKASNCEELLDRYNFTEWEMSEWSDQQAVFTFLYDSIELTIIFGPPVDGAVFNDNPCRKIINMSFESLLDEKKAPLSSCLVQRLIFQFIESQGFWQTKCTTMQHLPQMLHEISLVVNRCRLLGEEIEFLNRWGGKCNLLKTEVDNTKVKLLFSSCTAFAKFEVIFSLSANYPSTPLQFTVQKQIGSLGHDEISAVLSSVPLGTNYLKRMVKMIHHNLLQGSLTVH